MTSKPEETGHVIEVPDEYSWQEPGFFRRRLPGEASYIYTICIIHFAVVSILISAMSALGYGRGADISIPFAVSIAAAFGTVALLVRLLALSLTGKISRGDRYNWIDYGIVYRNHLKHDSLSFIYIFPADENPAIYAHMKFEGRRRIHSIAIPTKEVADTIRLKLESCGWKFLDYLDGVIAARKNGKSDKHTQ